MYDMLALGKVFHDGSVLASIARARCRYTIEAHHWSTRVLRQHCWTSQQWHTSPPHAFVTRLLQTTVGKSVNFRYATAYCIDERSSCGERICLGEDGFEPRRAGQTREGG